MTAQPAQSATRSESKHTHINLLVKASQKKVAGTGGQTRGSKRTWAEMDIDEEADEGKQKWEEKWSSTDTMDNDTLRDMQDIFIYRVQERKMTPASFTNVAIKLTRATFLLH